MTSITTGELMHVYGGFGAKVDYTVRLSIRLTDPVDAQILRRALDRTMERYPYLLVRLKRNEEVFYYEDNPLPVALLHANDRISLGTEETNHHLWAICFYEDYIHLDIFHGLTDGQGMYRILATLLYYYCYERYGETDHEGIGLCTDVISQEEIMDPMETLPAPDPSTGAAPAFQPAFTLETDGGLTTSEPTIWDVEIPEDELMRFVTVNDSTPGTMISLLMAKAIDSLYPKRDKNIIGVYVINARPMLKAPLTHHVCLGMAFLEYSDKIKNMTLLDEGTIYRGKTFAQSYDPVVYDSLRVTAAQLRAAAESAPTVEAKKEIFGKAFNGGEGFVTYLVSYTGQWKHRAQGKYMREFWGHPSNTFGLMVEILAAGGRIFVTIQQRFREDCVREAFLRQLDEHNIPFVVRRVMKNDVAKLPEPER